MVGSYEFGVEEEYFLADTLTGGSPQEAETDRFHAAASEKIDSAEHELLKGQVEFASKPTTSPDETCETLRTTRRALSELAAEHKLALFAAGSHPLGSFDRQATTEKERYRQLEDQFGIIAHRSMCCAMHVHVAIPAEQDRVRVMNRLIPFLPLLLALSTSSPFWNGEEGGLRCTRLAVFSEWPRMGLPDLFASEPDFNVFVNHLVKAGKMENASYLWWLIRPSNKYPTLEMRICDSCTRVEESVAIASLYRCLVHAAVRRPIINAGVGPLDRAIAAENIWQAQRHGTQALFVDSTNGTVSSVADVLEHTLSLVAEDAKTLRCEEWASRTRAIVANGSSADRQLARYLHAREAGADTQEGMRAVVNELAAETAA